MFDDYASWVRVPGNMKHRRIGWAPTVLRRIAKVAEELPALGGGQRASASCPPHREHGSPGGSPPNCDYPPPPDSI